MARVGFLRLGSVLLVILPAFSLACDMLSDPGLTLDLLKLDNGSVMDQFQADLDQCRTACCNRTRCDFVQVNLSQEGAGPNCLLIHCMQDPCLFKGHKQDQVWIYRKNRTKPPAEQRGRLSPLMVQPTPETRENTENDTKHDGTEGDEPDSSPALNKTDTETTETVKDGEQPGQSDQDRSVRCRLPKKVGPCRAAFRKFFYNSTSQICTGFIYGGCGANANNFQTKQECEETCGGMTGAVLPDESTPGPRQINAQVLSSKGVAKPADTPPDSAGRTALCSSPPDPGRCRGYFRMFYYESSSATCKEFIYGGCQGNQNRHGSLEECMSTCSKDGSFGARGRRRNWTAGVFLFIALAAISALLLGALITITLRRNRLPRRPSSISDKEELLPDDASSLDSVGVPPSPKHS